MLAAPWLGIITSFLTPPGPRCVTPIVVSVAVVAPRGPRRSVVSIAAPHGIDRIASVVAAVLYHLPHPFNCCVHAPVYPPPPPGCMLRPAPTPCAPPPPCAPHPPRLPPPRPPCCVSVLLLHLLLLLISPPHRSPPPDDLFSFVEHFGQKI